ncbi:MAG: hypothetical protein OJF52_001176 [Nitrospira sp.]|jgi:TolA-binding protein|nr:MAG: hypothetical protein OJF52_001176 [Nitrospira sp.]
MGEAGQRQEISNDAEEKLLELEQDVLQREGEVRLLRGVIGVLQQQTKKVRQAIRKKENQETALDKAIRNRGGPVWRRARRQRPTRKERAKMRTVASEDARTEADGKSVEDLLNELAETVHIFETAVRIRTKLRDREIVAATRLCGTIRTEVSKLLKACQRKARPKT